MHGGRFGRIVRQSGGWAMAFTAVFVAVLVAAPSARAHGGVSIGIGFGFPVFVRGPFFAPSFFFRPPPVFFPPPFLGFFRPPATIQASLSRGTPSSSLLFLFLTPP